MRRILRDPLRNYQFTQFGNKSDEELDRAGYLRNLRIFCVLCIGLFPVFYWLLAPYDIEQGDSIILRWAVALSALFILVGSFITDHLAKYAKFFCTMTVTATLIACHMVVVNVGAQPMYIAAGLIATFGSSLVFLSIKEATFAALTSISSYILYILIASELNTQQVVGWLINIVAYVIGLIGIYYRVIARREILSQQRTLLELSVKDRLTGLYNRHKLDEEITHQMMRFSLNETPFSLILLDIDHFKAINDTYGHQHGDIVLKQIGVLLLGSFYQTDLVGRWGGEEFLIILPNTDLAAAEVLAEKTRRKIDGALFPKVGSVTCSFSVAVISQGEKAENLFNRLDEALYHSKVSGRNRVTVSNLNA